MSDTESISVSAVIAAPIWRVYQNWRRLERFPNFVPSVREARWLSKDQLYWREEHEGTEYESTFEVKMNVAESSLAWRSLSGPENSGTAVVQAQPGGWSRITLTVNFVPNAEAQTRAAVKARHQDFLFSFKRFVESALRRA